MDSLKLFDYRSQRSTKARLSTKFTPLLVKSLPILMLLLLVLGVFLLINEAASGWFLIGLSAVPAVLVEWYNGELRNLAVSKRSKTIDGSLASDVLGRLSKNPTPLEVAQIVSRLPGGQFLAVRFGLSGQFLFDISSSDVEAMPAVWQIASDLRQQTGSDSISATILVVALIQCVPNYQSLLNHLQLDNDDLLLGIEWYNHLCNLIGQSQKPKRTGGIARDWSFGWTPLLSRYGVNISHQFETRDSLPLRLIAHSDVLDQIVNIFSHNGRQNAVLVGPSGSGKSEIIHAFSAKLLDAASELSSNLKFRQVFILDSSALIAAAPRRGELEQLITQILNEAYQAKNVIICLDNAQLFFEDSIGSVDMSNLLMPILDAGKLRLILTMDEQRYLQISKRNPDLVNSLNRIIVGPTDKNETMMIMQDQSIILEFQNHVTYMHQALAEAYRLGERYVHDLAMPGKALKLLADAAQCSENGLVTARSVQQSIEKTLNIKVGVVADGDERQKLLNLENLIHERMINQNRAVKVVSDALRRARTGVRSQNRPIGTFLFMGPTGVGKTELAKSLAAVYFGGEDHLVRLDMNEYTSSSDVERLIADAADNANSLTAQVMKQPFSVVLLDEIEKAHKDVLSTLLQLLDEGILRDVRNREISFRDTIIIATSNAGADRIREYIDRGLDIEKFEDKFVNELIDSNQFRPEFLNRFDEIVMFRPLKKTELIQVVDLILKGVNKTLEPQKISVDVAPEAKDYLVEAGYDPRLGARPMRRVVQRAVENTIASQMLAGTAVPGSVIKITLEQVKNILDTKSEAEQIISDQSANDNQLSQ